MHITVASIDVRLSRDRAKVNKFALVPLIVLAFAIPFAIPFATLAAEDTVIPLAPNTQNSPMTFERVQRCMSVLAEPKMEAQKNESNKVNKTELELKAELNSGAKCLNVPLDFGSGPIILAQGTIALHSSDTLAQITPDWPQGAIIAFQSLGGDLMGGLRLGQYIRARGFYTYVPNGVVSKDNTQPGKDTSKDTGKDAGKDAGKCFSACAYSFLGGVARRVHPQALYGVHQFRAQESGLDSVQTQKISAVLAKYMDAMNVSRLLLDQAMLTDPGKVNIINEGLRRSWKVEAAVDYTAQQALPKWRLEVSASGNRLAFSSRKQTNSAAVVTIALTPINGQMRLLLIVKPDPLLEGTNTWVEYFTKEVSLQVQDGSKIHVLQPITGWGRAGTVNTPSTKQIWFAINDELIQELKGSRQFSIKPLWPDLPKGLDAENVFGTDGLVENLVAL